MKTDIVPDHKIYSGIEDDRSFIRRVSEFMKEIESEYCSKEVNILISGHRCTFLIETDYPYLMPELLKGKRKDSSMVRLVVEKIANTKG